MKLRMNTLYKFLLIIICSAISTISHGQFTVDFSASTVTACAGEPINFTDLSFSPGGVTSWVWDFGDGNSSMSQNPTHAYTAAGTYTVILTANNGSSSLDEVKLNYITINPLPQPSFTLSNPPCTLPASVSVSNVTPTSGVSYQWNFGNGQTSTAQNPTNPSYSTEGTFNVQLTVTNTSTGCSNSTSQALNIFNYNTAFTPSETTVCAGSSVSFTDNSSPGTNSYAWTFGNGQNSTFSSPTVVYNNPGTYTVTLTSQNTLNGCSDVATQVITVIDAQVPSLSPSLTIGCNPSTVTFTNTSNFNGTFNWNFGNGNTFIGENPPAQTYSMEDYNEYPYPLSDSFGVIIYSTDENGCTSFQAYPNLISIYNIVPTFTSDVREGCEDLPVTFTDNSYSPIPGFPINSWQWTFGNGQTFTGQNPPTQLYSEGEYDVSLTVSTAMGCTTTVDSLEFIQVGVPPDVLFTADPDTLCARQTGTFVNLTTVSVPSDPSDFIYYWYLGNQGPYGDFEPNNTPITDTGAIDITLIVSFRGCRDTLTLEDEMYIHAPLVQFSTPGILCNPGIPVDVTINEYSILGQAGDSVAVFWNLGDGTTLNYDDTDAWLNNNQSFNHTYTEYGDYEIQQKIWNFETGCVDSLSSVLSINYFALNLDFFNDSICFGDTSEFQWGFQSIAFYPITQYNYVADVDSILGYSYNMGEISNPDACYFGSTGNHQIQVNATNSLGCQASVTETVYVAPLPEAEIGPIQVAGCVPTLATFTDASTSVSGIPIVDYNWTFNGVSPVSGNGQATINTIVDTTGIHTAMLEVTDALGCTNTATLQTNFLEPIANFDAPEVICNNSTFTTPNLSSNYTASEWYFNGVLMSTDTDGNFTVSHPVNPTVLSYSDSITLVVTDANGCTSEMTIPVITSSPNADFDYSFTGSNVDEFGNFACPSVFAAFADQSQSYGDVVSWSWDFGDGKFSSLQNPSNTYVFAGTYTSSLTIEDEFGCQSTIVYDDYLTINGPSGTFDVGPAGTPCDPNYLFSSLTLNNVSNVEWFPGNGSSFNSLTGDEYIYAAAGTYFPYVTITDNNNCAVTYYLDTLNVQFGNLNAAFTATPSELNWGEPLVVVNQSTGGNGGIVNNNWTFGTDNFNNQSSQFNYLFNEAGELQILLIVTDAIGCIDSAWISVNVTDNLELPNVFSPNGDGVNDVLRIRDNAYGEYEVVILNRWGNEMSRAYIVNDDYLWDGKTQNGTIATEGVYFYFVNGKLRDGKANEDHGFFHLVIPE